jgi:hypothetical protein
MLSAGFYGRSTLFKRLELIPTNSKHKRIRLLNPPQRTRGTEHGGPPQTVSNRVQRKLCMLFNNAVSAAEVTQRSIKNDRMIVNDTSGCRR